MASSDLSSLVAAQRLARIDDAQASRERWRAIADHLSAGKQDVSPTEILDLVLAALASPRNDSPSSVRCAASALKALHVLLLSKEAGLDGSDTLWLRLSQPQLKDCVDALLLTACLYAPRKAAGGSSNNSLSRSASHTSLASIQSLSIRSDDDAGATTTDYASDARSTTTTANSDAASRLNASCRSVRLNSLSCLAALNETRPALFFSQWPRLLLAEQQAPSMPTGLGLRQSRGALSGSSSSSFSTSGGILTLIKSDPVLGVRIAAASLVEAMFRKAAQGRFLASGVVEQRSAFTSLAARMGTLVASVRGALVDVIEKPNRRSSIAVAGPLQTSRTPSTAPGAPAAPGPLIEAVLRALKALVLATPTAKLRRPHLDVLQGPLLRLSSHAEPSVAIAAYVVLSTLSPAGSGGESSTLPLSGPASSPVEGIISRLLGSDTSASSGLDGEALAQAWSALAGLLSAREGEVWQQEAALLARLEGHAGHAEQAVRQACISFVGAALDGQVAAGGAAGSLACYAKLSRKAASDPSPLVRIEVAQALPALLRLEAAAALASSPTPNANEMQALLPPSASILSALLLDVDGGGEASVQAAAVRAVGVLFSSSSEPAAPSSSTSAPPVLPALDLTALLPLALEEALCPALLRSPALLVRLRAAWTLANVCQALAENRAPTTHALDAVYPDLWPRLLAMTRDLLTDDERVASNAMRAAGLLFSVARREELLVAHDTGASPPRSSLEVLSTILERSRTAQSPKLQWNAVNALAAALSNGAVRAACADAPAGDEELGTTTTTLASLLCRRLSSDVATSRIFKVRLAAITALRRLSTPLEFGGAQSARTALERVAEARQRVDADVAEATFREAQLHGQALKNGLEGLEEHLSGVLERGA